MSIHWTVRYSAFAASVFTLSLFFAGWREVMQTGSPAAFVLLATGTLSTVGFLALQAYWVYFEEKHKGKLVRHNEWFEKTYQYVEQHQTHNKLIRYIQPGSSQTGPKKIDAKQSKAVRPIVQKDASQMEASTKEGSGDQ